MASKDKILAYDLNYGFGMPLNIRRGNPLPLDNSAVWATMDEAKEYAKNSPIAYVGQVLTVLHVDEKHKAPAVYVIINENGDLVASNDSAQNTVKFVKVTTDTENKWEVYCGYTITDDPVLDEDGLPTVDEDENPITTPTRHDIKIGEIIVPKDKYVVSGKIVTTESVMREDEDGYPIMDANGFTYDIVDSDGDTLPYPSQEGIYIKLKLSNSEYVYVLASLLLSGYVTKIKTSVKEYLPDDNGMVDISTLSTDEIKPGTVDNWILICGNASTGITTTSE